ncbi:MAG: hypothetical protein K2Y21_10875 [Phycisphaerales bacterium]|nr:hypothetical protein [Phycisphaerales bacterium]
MNPSVANARLAKLRGYRVVPAADRSIRGEIERVAAETKRADRAVGRIGEVWDAVAPDQWRALATPTAFRAGVLELACAAAAVRFEVDRWLQGGGRKMIESTLGAPIFRVVFVSGGRAVGGAGASGGAGGKRPRSRNRRG